MSTQESAEKLMRRCARPIPAAASASAAGVGATAGDEAREVGMSPLIADDAAGGAPAAEDSAAPLAGAALDSARRGSFAGAVLRWCHGFHHSTPRISSSKATKPPIRGHGRSLT